MIGWTVFATHPIPPKRICSACLDIVNRSAITHTVPNTLCVRGNSPVACSRGAFMGSLRSLRRAARRRANLRMEILEDRVVPDGTPGTFFDPTEDAPPPVPPPDAVQVDWLGQTRLAAPGRWIVRADGLTGTAAEQITAFEPVVDALGLDVHVETQLGLDGLFRLAGPADLTVQLLSDSLGQVPGVRYVEPDFVDAAAQVIPNDPSFNQLWGMNN